MTKEERDLLLKDLCEKLPYGVKCSFGVNDEIYDVCGVNPTCCGASEIQATHIKSGINVDFLLSDCKPYLLPLSRMNKEQERQYSFFSTIIFSCFEVDLCEAVAEFHDWFNRNHFDYRNLIGKGLAIDATGLNIY